jgi:hypothetical protein
MRWRLILGSLISASLAASVHAWFSYPVPFTPPPPFESLEVAKGTMGFMTGRNEPTLTIGGRVFVCYFSASRGPFGTCLLEHRSAPMVEVHAHWYLHEQKWPGKGIAMLMHVATSDGRVLLDYAAQRSRLETTVERDSALSSAELFMRSSLVFVGAFVSTFFFFRKGAK